MASATRQIPLVVDYDADADALYVACGEARPSVGKRTGNGFIVRYSLTEPSNPTGVIVQDFKANGWASNRVELARAIADILRLKKSVSSMPTLAEADRLECYFAALRLVRLWRICETACFIL